VLTLLYLALAGLGIGYLVVSTVTGHLLEALGDGGHAAGAGAADAAYGVEGTGHGSVSAADSGATGFHFPFFSPLALAMLFASLGAYGLIAKHGFGAGDAGSLLAATPLALATAYGVTYLGWRVLSASRGSSQIRAGEVVGATGEVLTPIPPGGVGEVAALVGGQRVSGPAREAAGRAVARGAAVRVVRVMGATLVVERDAPADAKGGGA
jgi:membrane protein implicated in regulation of membrane protease activity